MEYSVLKYKRVTDNSDVFIRYELQVLISTLTKKLSYSVRLTKDPFDISELEDEIAKLANVQESSEPTQPLEKVVTLDASTIVLNKSNIDTKVASIQSVDEIKEDKP